MQQARKTTIAGATRRWRIALMAAAVIAGSAIAIAQRAQTPAAYASSCSALNGLAVRGLIVTDALRFDAGEWAPPPGVSNATRAARLFSAVPEFCRLLASPLTTDGGQSGMEVWLPTRSWNGRLVATGTATDSRTADYPMLAAAVARGDGVVSMTTPPGLTPRLGAAREVVLAAGDLVRGYFGVGPRFVLWAGCGANAAIGLHTAVTFPADVDGVAAMAPRATSPSPAVQNLEGFLARGKLIVVEESGEARGVHDRLSRVPAAIDAARVVTAAVNVPCDAAVTMPIVDALAGWLERGVPPNRIDWPQAPQPALKLLCVYPQFPILSARDEVGDGRQTCGERRQEPTAGPTRASS